MFCRNREIIYLAKTIATISFSKNSFRNLQRFVSVPKEMYSYETYFNF